MEGLWWTTRRCGLPEPQTTRLSGRGTQENVKLSWPKQGRSVRWLPPLLGSLASSQGPRPSKGLEGIMMAMCTVPRGQGHGFLGPDPYLLSPWLPPSVSAFVASAPWGTVSVFSAPE